LNKGITSIIVSAANEMLLSRVIMINDKSFIFKVNLLGVLISANCAEGMASLRVFYDHANNYWWHIKLVPILLLTLLPPTIINFVVITFPT
jgi:hypothetical protein